MRAKETFDSSWAEWREAQVRGAVEGDARLRQTELTRGERPHLPDGSAVMDLDAVERVHQAPWEIAPIQELPQK
ncbi:hypothetical protein D3C72_240110 [compost metagenome]